MFVAFVRVLVDAGDHQADDKLLQRPVVAELAEQGDHLALVDLEIDAVERTPLEIGFFGIAAGVMYLGTVLGSRTLLFASVIALTPSTSSQYRVQRAHAMQVAGSKWMYGLRSPWRAARRDGMRPQSTGAS